MNTRINIVQTLRVYRSLCRSYCDSSKHIYETVIPFETNKQLATYLCNNIIYNKYDYNFFIALVFNFIGIIVINKPYGICFSRDGPQWRKCKEVDTKRTIKHKLAALPDYNQSYVGAELDNVNLHDALPYIKSNLNCESLCVIKSPEKYTSGVCILGHSESVRTKLKKCWERSRAQKVAIETYITICTGIPIKHHTNNLRVGVTLDVAENGKSKKAILTKNYSKRSVLSSKVKVAMVNTSLLSVNADESASVVEITSNQKKWHFIRLFLSSNLLSPAIGDHLYGSRVKKIMGTYLAIHHWNEHASLPQKLPSELLKQLELQPGSERYIPTMIHLSEVNLVGFPDRSKNIIVSAPIPLHFSWTIDKLGLHMPTRALTLKTENCSDKMVSFQN